MGQQEQNENKSKKEINDETTQYYRKHQWNSIKTKVFGIVVIVVIVCGTLLGSVCCYFNQRMMNATTKKNMQLEVISYGNQLQGLFSASEKMGTGFADMAGMNIPDNLSMLTEDRLATKNYVDRMRRVSSSVVSDKSMDSYMFYRLNPQFFGGKEGFYVHQRRGADKYASMPLTDFSKFSLTDERVEWFYKPISEKKSQWMQTSQVNVPTNKFITYVSPVFKDDTPIGVVGVQIPFSTVAGIIGNINLCNSDVAMLLSPTGELIVHSDFGINSDESQLDVVSKKLIKNVGKYVSDEPVMQTINGYKYLVYEQTMTNGMTMIVAAPKDEMYQSMWNFALIVLSICVLILVSVVYFLNKYITKLLSPLFDLTVYADKIAKGDYSETIEIERDDEIGVLANAFRNMTIELNKYFSYMKKVAYRDGLTGLRNRSAYIEHVKECEKLLTEPECKLAFVYMDVNNLKKVNDTRGHELGDKMLLDAAFVIRQIFGDYSTYRIGGDEFVAILHDTDAERVQKHIRRFNNEIGLFNSNKPAYGELSIAVGYANYHEGDTMEEIFSRADEKMYVDKKRKKNT